MIESQGSGGSLGPADIAGDEQRRLVRALTEVTLLAPEILSGPW